MAGVEAIASTIRDNPSNSAAESLEYYLQLTEILFRRIASGKSNNTEYWKTRAELMLLSNNQRKAIRSTQGWNVVYYLNKGDASSADYWSKVAEYFDRNFTENLKYRIDQTRQSNPAGLVLVKENSVR